MVVPGRPIIQGEVSEEAYDAWKMASLTTGSLAALLEVLGPEIQALSEEGRRTLKWDDILRRAQGEHQARRSRRGAR
jgi:hypothetical protein